ncbi:hypothetical protein MSPP1_003190 [Malassezia sp. CBS 17886]|nr:hypothetical protein MSPP1_003190 [Malassezia sp. CBS 17886]
MDALQGLCVALRRAPDGRTGGIQNGGRVAEVSATTDRAGAQPVFVLSSSTTKQTWTLCVTEAGDGGAVRGGGWWLGERSMEAVREMAVGRAGVPCSSQAAQSLPVDSFVRRIADAWTPQSLGIRILDDAETPSEEEEDSAESRPWCSSGSHMWDDAPCPSSAPRTRIRRNEGPAGSSAARRSDTKTSCLVTIALPDETLHFELAMAVDQAALAHAAHMLYTLARRVAPATEDSTQESELERMLNATRNALDAERTKYRELIAADPKVRAKFSNSSIVNPGRIRRRTELGGFDEEPKAGRRGAAHK